MKRADLDRAVGLVAEQNADQRLVARLRAGERLRLTIGGDGKESEIVLAAGFEKALRADLDAAFSARIEARAASLAALGVEE